jgi:hypothetical protein
MSRKFSGKLIFSQKFFVKTNIFSKTWQNHKSLKKFTKWSLYFTFCGQVVPFCIKTVKSQHLLILLNLDEHFCDRFSWFSYNIASNFHENTKTNLLVSTLSLRHTRTPIMPPGMKQEWEKNSNPQPLPANVGKSSICYTERRKAEFQSCWLVQYTKTTFVFATARARTKCAVPRMPADQGKEPGSGKTVVPVPR